MNHSNSPEQVETLVLGGGIAGLASAALLGARGHKVSLVEGQSWWGGKLRRLYFSNDDIIDSGPSIFTLPIVWQNFVKAWEEASGLAAPELDRHKYKGVGYYSFDDGELDLASTTHDALKDWSRYLEKHEKSAEDLTAMTFLDPKSRHAFKPGLRLVKDHRFRRSMEEYLDKDLELERKTADIIRIHALNTGSTPANLPAFFASLAASLYHGGVSAPKGGMYELVHSLLAMNEAIGNKLYKDHEILEISENQVKTNKLNFKYEQLVNSIDIDRFHELRGRTEDKTKEKKWTASALAIYGQLNEGWSCPERYLDEHLVLMPSDTPKFFKELHEKDYLSSTMSFVSVHPPGSHIYPGNTKATFSLIITTHPDGSDINQLSDLVDSEWERLERRGFKNFRSNISEQFCFDPKYYAGFGALGGSLYGPALKAMRAGPFHPVPYKDKLWSKTWHVGTRVHPGGGIPAVLGGVLIGSSKIPEPKR